MTKKSLLLSAVLVAGFVCLGGAVVSKAFADEVAIEIELPEPFFGGTPIDYWSPNLEPEDFKDRPPFMAPEGTELISKDKAVTSSEVPVHGQLKQITDGDKDYARSSTVELPGDLQWVQIDLEEDFEIYAIVVWHFHEGKRVYFDVVVQVSNDEEFGNDVTTVYNNDHDNSSGLGVGEDKEYQESYQGRLMDAKGVSGRFVRLYTSGNTADDFNHYVEVEVYGK
jgi:hypothetical protein